MAARSILDMLAASGCAEIPWREMVSLYEGDPIAAEARVALAAARTERTAALLLDQYRGALRSELVKILCFVRAGQRAEAVHRLRALERLAPLGLHLTVPWRVVLAGRPNVGKSSLINAILGYQRSIVYEAPGTTRDVVTAHTAIDGWPVELADTAGLRDSGDTIERCGVSRAWERLAAADLAVLVFDLAQPWTSDAAALVRAWPRAILVHNKSDLAARSSHERPPGILTSAVTGEGVQELIGAIGARLVPDPPSPGTAMPFRARHVDAVRECLDLIESGQIERARKTLEALLPE